MRGVDFVVGSVHSSIVELSVQPGLTSDPTVLTLTLLFFCVEQITEFFLSRPCLPSIMVMDCCVVVVFYRLVYNYKFDRKTLQPACILTLDYCGKVTFKLGKVSFKLTNQNLWY